MVEIPGYRIERELGAGGMATVYLAVQESLDREVALKIMTPGLAVDETYCHRFLKEGRITAQLAHPNLLTVYDTGVHEHHYYMASEFLPGGTARDKMQEGLTHEAIAKMVGEIAAGLGFAHSKGFVHRDVKPGNMLFRNNGDCVLGDFGIAKAVDSNTGATKLGTSIGTPHYMSPEQAKGEKVDHRTDLYSLGVVFYELLTGKPPFDADDPFTVALAQINEPVPALPKEHARFQTLIERLMEKNRDQRYATAEDFIVDLKAEMGGGAARPAPAPKPAPVSAPAPAPARSARAEREAPRRQRRARGGGLPVTKIVAIVTALIVIGGGSFVGYNKWKSGGGGNGGASSSETQSISEPYASQLTRAAEHVSAGRFVAPAGSNALDVYRRILNEDPGNESARAGVERLPGQIEKAAEVAWAGGDADAAKRLLDAGLRAFPDATALRYLLDQVERELAESAPEPPASSSEPRATPASGGDEGEIANLVRLADKYYDANILSHPPGENATDVYLQVIAIDPSNARARSRLDEIAGTWASAAETNLRRGKLQIARRMIEKGLQASPENEKLLRLQQQLESEDG